jgi:D-aminoacyl-tRNA deacylase
MPFYTLVCSTKDPASANVADLLVNRYAFTSIAESLFSSIRYPYAQLHLSHEILLYADDLDEIYPETGCFVFISKHKSSSKFPTLTCHSTGNFNDNLYGGKFREIGLCYPWIQKQYLMELNKVRHNVPQYDITLEASHHGPTSLKKPSCFIEIGSTEKEWSDSLAVESICTALLSLISVKPSNCRKVAIAVGGNHYPKKFNKILLNSEFGLASIVSKHNLQYVDQPMIEQMISKSTEQVSYAIYDSKGLGNEKRRLLQLLVDAGLEVVKA